MDDYQVRPTEQDAEAYYYDPATQIDYCVAFIVPELSGTFRVWQEAKKAMYAQHGVCHVDFWRTL